MSHTVVVHEFEGPLGLLLELVERGRLEVTTISVSEVAAQYLERLSDLPERGVEDMSEFLELGCRLLYIKSLALLPRDNTTEQIDELRQLNQELSQYQRFRQAAKDLARRSQHSMFHRTTVERLAPAELPMPQLNLNDLAGIFQQALQRVEPARPTGMVQRILRQEDMASRLIKQLRRGSITLQDELERASDRLEIIVLFTALLELIKTNIARVTQADQFAPIIIEAV